MAITTRQQLEAIGRQAGPTPQPPSYRESKLLSQTADRALWKTKTGSRWVWIIAHYDGIIDHDAPLVGGYAGNYRKAKDAIQAWSQMGGGKVAAIRPKGYVKLQDPKSIRDMGTYRVVRVQGDTADLARSKVWEDTKVIRQEPVASLKAVEPNYRDLLAGYYDAGAAVRHRVLTRGDDVESAMRKSVRLRGAPRKVFDLVREMASASRIARIALKKITDDTEVEFTGEFIKTSPVKAVQMDEAFTVDTLEGDNIKGKAGDYLCEGVEGERWPIDKDIFESTYEKKTASLVATRHQARVVAARLKQAGWWSIDSDQPPVDKGGLLNAIPGVDPGGAANYLGDGPLDERINFVEKIDEMYRAAWNRPVTIRELEALFDVPDHWREKDQKWNEWIDVAAEHMGVPQSIVMKLPEDSLKDARRLWREHLDSGYEVGKVYTLKDGPPPPTKESLDEFLSHIEASFNLHYVDAKAFSEAVPMDKLDSWAKKAASDAHARSIALMKFLSKVARRLGVAEHVYVVGGAVRNFIIDRPIKDIDVVIDSVALGGKKDSDWFAKQLERSIPTATNLTTNQYGVAILTIKGSWVLDGVEMKGEVIEIANARKESYGGASGKGYKPSEVVPATIEEDVVRREFTFNALMWRLLDLARGPDQAEIIDLTGCGRRDLENREMRCPADPDKVFADDPTRLMRAIKFVAKYGFKIPPDLAAAIKRNAPKMKQAPWEASGTLLVENVLKESTARKALKLMDDLGLISVVAEMVQESKPFQSYLAGQLRDQKVQVLLDLMDLGLDVRSPVTFLTRSQQQRLREVTIGMPEGEAERFLAVLKKPPLNNMTLITQFNIPPHERGSLAALAREALLEDPDMASNPNILQRVVERHLSRQYRTASRPQQNPYASEFGGSWSIKFDVGKQEPLVWTTSGFKDARKLDYMRRPPEDFRSKAEADRKIQGEILDFIARYRDDQVGLVRGWEMPRTATDKVAYVRAEQVLRRFLPKDWPDDVLSELAEEFMWMEQRDTEPWSVRDVQVERMFDSFYERIERMDRRGEIDGESSWYRRYENGDLDAEVKKALKKIERAGVYRFAKVEGSVTGDGSSVGLFIPVPAELAAQFPSLGDEDTSPPHVTLLYVGPITKEQEPEFLSVVEKVLAQEPGPIRAQFAEVDKFTHPGHGRQVFYSPVRFSKDMGTLRDRLTAELTDAGIEVLNRFPLAYCPHTTLAYVDGTDNVYRGKSPTGAWEFSTIPVWGLPKHHELPLGDYAPYATTLLERQQAGLLQAWGPFLGDD